MKQLKSITEAYKSPMQTKLEQLGCRLGGNFTLHSGGFSNVKWDIERLEQYPPWVVEEAIKEFIWDIARVHAHSLIGIATGGKFLAYSIGRTLEIWDDLLDCIDIKKPLLLKPSARRPIVLIDDVLTTGDTIRQVLLLLGVKPDYIAVLVNRSQLTEIEGIPIISGFFADEVKP